MSLPVTEIFAIHGEDFFRPARNGAYTGNHQSRASGDSYRWRYVDRTGNMAAALANGLVMLLHAPVSVLVNRLGAATDRPLLDGFVPEERLQEIYRQRAAIYEGIQHRVDTSDGDLNKAAERIINLYLEWLNE